MKQEYLLPGGKVTACENLYAAKGLRGRKALNCKYYQRDSKDPSQKDKHEIVLSIKKLVALGIGLLANVYACLELLRLIHSFSVHVRWRPGFWLEVPLLIYGMLFSFAIVGWLISKAVLDERLNGWVVAWRSIIARSRNKE